MIKILAKFQLLAASALFLFSISASAQTPETSTISKMYGEAELRSNYVDRGLTQSDKKMSVEAGLGYWFGGLGRIGFKASSVSYQNESVNMQIRGFAEYKFVFSGTSELRFRNDLIRYYAEDRRNNTLITLDQTFLGNHLFYLRDDNFEGTKTHRNWFGLQKDWVLQSNLHLNATIGYSMLELTGFNNYFDSRLAVVYTTGHYILSLVNTMTSASSQFNGDGDMMFFLTLAATF